MIRRDRHVAEALAGLYVRAHRAAADVKGPATVIPAMPLERDRVQTSLAVTGANAIKVATGAGLDETAAMNSALVQLTGASTRHVLNGARDVVRYSSEADPAVAGWARSLGPQSCDFCRMLAGRGAVYSPTTADFASHDHCSCSASPAYGGPSTTVRPYEPTSRPISEADRARTKAWIKANSPPGGLP